MGPSKRILMLTTSTLVFSGNSSSSSSSSGSSNFVSALSPPPVGLASILSSTTKKLSYNNNNDNDDGLLLISSSIITDIRGGASGGGSSATSSSSKRKKKKKKSKKRDDDGNNDEEVDEGSSSSSSSDTTTTTTTSKKVIDDAMKEKDAAEALGDAIRDRADVLRSEDPLLQSIDWSVSSVGTALGASDQRMKLMKDDDGGGVEASTTSILANYFIKSHGGAHALQCLCSFLATLCGLSSVLFHKTPSWGYVLLQRTMLFAMVKHVSGLLASAAIAAKAIPKIGLSQARQWMEQIALDPVSQYVFYTALILLWLPSKERLDSCWWWNNLMIAPSMLVGPVLLREIISTMLVVSDMLVLSTMGDNNSSKGIQTLLEISQSTINAGMSLLVSPEIWRNADPQQRQAILGKLVSRISLAFEVVVGLLLFADLGIGFVQTAFYSGQNRPPFRESLTRLICVRLYLHFLWIRRKRISQLAVQVRGGASQLPIWFLDLLYDPAKSMGLDYSNKIQTNKEEEKNQPENDDVSPSSFTWKDYVWTALGIK